MHHHHFHRQRSFKRRLAGQHLVADDAASVDVRLRGQLHAARLLRAHVRGRAKDGAGARLLRIGRVHLGHREVQHLHKVARALHLDEEHVVRLDIAVDDALLVCFLQRLTDLRQDAEHALRRQLAQTDDLVG